MHQAPAPIARRCIPGLLEDPAVLIGLTMALVRHGPLPHDVATDPVLQRLQEVADRGDPACRLLVGWLKHRYRDLWPAGLQDPDSGSIAEIIAAGGPANG